MVEAIAVATPDIRVTNLWRRYREGPRTLEILRGAELEVMPGRSVAIVGRSGAGKSTLLHHLGLLDRPSEGSVEIKGINATRASRAVRDRLRREQIGFVFQFYHLLPELDALQNVVISAMLSVGPLQWLARRKSERARAEALLERVGLKERMRHLPSKLSGGEQQRVAIARALFRSPEILLCDEPTGNLDEQTSAEVEDLLLGLVAERQTTLLLVTHNLPLARRLDRVLLLEAGVLKEVGSSDDEETLGAL